MSLRSAWSTERVPGQLRVYRETLSLKKNHYLPSPLNSNANFDLLLPFLCSDREELLFPTCLQSCRPIHRSRTTAGLWILWHSCLVRAWFEVECIVFSSMWIQHWYVYRNHWKTRRSVFPCCEHGFNTSYSQLYKMLPSALNDGSILLQSVSVRFWTLSYLLFYTSHLVFWVTSDLKPPLVCYTKTKVINSWKWEFSQVPGLHTVISHSNLRAEDKILLPRYILINGGIVLV